MILPTVIIQQNTTLYLVHFLGVYTRIIPRSDKAHCMPLAGVVHSSAAFHRVHRLHSSIGYVRTAGFPITATGSTEEATAAVAVHTIRHTTAAHKILRGTIVNRTYGTHKNLYIVFPCFYC